MKIDRLYKTLVSVCLLLITLILMLIMYFEYQANVKASNCISEFTNWSEDSFTSK